jgi:hypothetical protein
VVYVRLDGETDSRWRRYKERGYETTSMSSLAQSSYTISGETRVGMVHNLHKKPGRGCFPLFRGDFWPCGFAWSVACRHISFAGFRGGGGAQEAGSPTVYLLKLLLSVLPDAPGLQLTSETPDDLSLYICCLSRTLAQAQSNSSHRPGSALLPCLDEAGRVRRRPSWFQVGTRARWFGPGGTKTPTVLRAARSC